jgi:hypothetical protein
VSVFERQNLWGSEHGNFDLLPASARRYFWVQRLVLEVEVVLFFLGHFFAGTLTGGTDRSAFGGLSDLNLLALRHLL